MPNSIRARLTLQFAVCIFALMLASCLLLTRYAQKQAENNADALLHNAAAQIGHELPIDAPTLNLTELREVESDLDDNHLAIVLLDAQGRVVETYPAASSLAQALPGSSRQAEWRTLNVPTGAYKVVVGLPWARTQRGLDTQARTLFVFSMATGILATLGAWLLVGRTLSPIGKLSQQAQVLGGGENHIQLVPPSQDAEVQELVQTLNDLLARQSETIAARGRFYAAASHELRTPLQALSGHLELALQRPRSREEYHDAVQEANAQTRRLTSLVRDLLRLHQLEGSPRPPQEPVDLTEVCARTLRTLTNQAQARNLNVEVELAEEVIVAAAATHADILVRNLLENAVRYATAGRTVCLRLSTVGSAAHLEIANSCETSASDSPDKWFEAFYRPDASRNLQSGGNGLGLAICKAVSAVNGWQLTLNCEAGWVTAQVAFSLDALPL